MSLQLLVFAKAPQPGLAKTRLAPALGFDGAARLAVRLLDHAVREALATVGHGVDEVALCVAPDAAHPAFQRLLSEADCIESWEQGDGDLGARMARAVARALRRHRRVLVIGTDAPALDRHVLAAAARALDAADAVFVPALDGGYALVGLARPAPALFGDMPWSSADVMRLTRERARAEGLSWIELPPVHDIDVPADLAQLPPGWRA